MSNKNNHSYLLSDLTKLRGVGNKIADLLKKKNINTIFDLLWKLPKSYTDRRVSRKIKDLKVGDIQTVNVIPYKYNFPRIRNLPNRVFCKDSTGNLDCVFFNSYEGYIRKVLPIGKEITISGKISHFRNKYQITNPKYIAEDSSIIKTKHNQYSLTEGITEKLYNRIIKQIIKDLPQLEEWHDNKILANFDNISWYKSINELHKPENIGNYKSSFYKRLAFDEIFSSFLVHSEIRKKIKKNKKRIKIFDFKKQNIFISNLEFELTKDQLKALNEINQDLISNQKMFRLLQGDVGSGKTIVAFISALNTINAGYQVAIMAPTEILARQHFLLAKRLFDKTINIDLLSSKLEYKNKKKIINDLKNHKINLIFGELSNTTPDAADISDLF